MARLHLGLFYLANSLVSSAILNVALDHRGVQSCGFRPVNGGVSGVIVDLELIVLRKMLGWDLGCLIGCHGELINRINYQRKREVEKGKEEYMNRRKDFFTPQQFNAAKMNVTSRT